MVLFERAENGCQVGVRFLDGRKQCSILTPVVAVECGTEAVAVKKQVAPGLLGRAPGAYGLLRDAQRLTDASVDAA